MDSFGENLKALRKLNKLSQKEFAVKMETTQLTLAPQPANQTQAKTEILLAQIHKNPTIQNIPKFFKPF